MIAEPVIRNFIVPQGVSYPVRMRWLSAPGVPVDLTGCEVRAQLRRAFSDAVPAVSCTMENGSAVLDVATGFFGFDLHPAVTSAIPATKYFYDLDVRAPSGQVTRAMQGAITLTPEVTKW